MSERFLLRKDTKKIISVLLYKSCRCELFLVYVQISFIPHGITGIFGDYTGRLNF